MRGELISSVSNSSSSISNLSKKIKKAFYKGNHLPYYSPHKKLMKDIGYMVDMLEQDELVLNHVEFSRQPLSLSF